MVDAVECLDFQSATVKRPRKRNVARTFRWLIVRERYRNRHQLADRLKRRSPPISSVAECTHQWIRTE